MKSPLMHLLILIVATSEVFAQAGSDSGLVVFYPFNGNANDESGNGYHGIVLDADLTSDRFGVDRSAYYFNGSSDSYIQASIPALPLGGADRTLCVWVKSEDGKTDGNSDHIANWGRVSAGNAFGLMLFIQDHWWGYGHIYQDYDTDSGIAADTSWHFLCCSYGNDTMKVYVDGNFAASRRMALNTIGPVLYIGIRPDRDIANAFDGLIDDIRIYNRVLSDSEIQRLYLPINAPSNLVALASGSSVLLTWFDNSNDEVGFKIESKAAQTGTFSLIATVNKDFTEFIDETVKTNQIYFYRIRAFSSFSHSEYSNEYAAITLAPPANLVANAISDTQIGLSWIDNTESETGYKLERAIGINGEWTEIADLAAGTNTYEDNNLVACKIYSYRLRAYANSTTLTPHFSNFSNIAAATTDQISGDRFALGFLLKDNNGEFLDPYTASINSVFDHSLKGGFYGETDKIVVAFTGEKGDRDEHPNQMRCGGSHRQENAAPFVVNGNYTHADCDADWLLYDEHSGIDYRSPTGASIYAPADGTVSIPSSDPVNGDPNKWNTLKIEHNNGYSTWYLHCSERIVTSGTVERGQLIARVGDKGVPGAPHLHFEVRNKDGIPLDPYGWQGIGADPYTSAINEFLWDISTDANEWIFDTNFNKWRTRDAQNQGINEAPNIKKWVIDPGSDPGIISPTLSRIDAKNFNSIEIRIAANGGGESVAKAFFKTANNQCYTSVRSIDFTPNIIRDGNLRVYSARMSDNSEWTGQITEIRIDPINEGDPNSDSDLIYIDRITFTNTVSVTELPTSEKAPQGHRLLQSYPNPFLYNSLIEYSLPKAEYVELTIHNSLGQRVSILVAEEIPSGFHKASWNGTDKFGKKLPGGIYFIRIQAGDFIETQKTVLLR